MVWGNNLECQGVGSLEAIENRKIEKTKCDQALHQEILLV